MNHVDYKLNKGAVIDCETRSFEIYALLLLHDRHPSVHQSRQGQLEELWNVTMT